MAPLAVAGLRIHGLRRGYDPDLVHGRARRRRLLRGSLDRSQPPSAGRLRSARDRHRALRPGRASPVRRARADLSSGLGVAPPTGLRLRASALRPLFSRAPRAHRYDGRHSSGPGSIQRAAAARHRGQRRRFIRSEHARRVLRDPAERIPAASGHRTRSDAAPHCGDQRAHRVSRSGDGLTGTPPGRAAAAGGRGRAPGDRGHGRRRHRDGFYGAARRSKPASGDQRRVRADGRRRARARGGLDPCAVPGDRPQRLRVRVDAGRVPGRAGFGERHIRGRHRQVSLDGGLAVRGPVGGDRSAGLRGPPLVSPVAVRLREALRALGRPRVAARHRLRHRPRAERRGHAAADAGDGRAISGGAERIRPREG